MVRIAIIDDHDVVRMGVRYMLKFGRGFAFAGEYGVGEGAGAFVRECNADVVLLDVRMPGIGGIGVLREIRREAPDAKVVMLTTSDAEEDIFAAINNGASGYILKDSKPAVIIEAISKVAAGETWFPESVQRVYECRSSERSLSPREVEVLNYVAKGMRNQDIADLIGVTLSCVKVHMSHVLDKLGAADRAEAVSLGISRGVITKSGIRS